MLERYKSPSVLKEAVVPLKEAADYHDISYTKGPDGLKIKLGPNFDKEELESDMDQRGIGATEADLFDKYLGMIGNGFQLIAPEQVGALTDSIILGEDVQTNEDGMVEQAEALYWYPDYQLRSFLDDLLEKGETFLSKDYFDKDEEPKEEESLEEGGMYV